MDWFDFERVHKTMVALNWEWVGEGVPSIQSIKQNARKQLENCSTAKHGFYSTGGFEAKMEVYEGEEIFSLKFVVSEWDNSL